MEKAVQPSGSPTTPPTSAPPGGEPDLSGRVIGDFRVLRRLGQGGMGQVFLAEQLSLKRHVALKFLRAELAANATALRRFQLEAEAVARINHANIVQVHAVGQAEGMHYMALEFVDGKNLREFIAKKGSPEVLQAIGIMRQVAAALQRASEVGIVHRDIKPENILLTRKGEVKVTDFGLSRCVVGSGQQPAVNLTQSGVTMGTPLYMSPEQVQGKDTDPRTDIYSFGVTCYHMLAGEPPYRGQSAIEVAIQHVQNTPQPLEELRPDLPVELCQIVHKMMTKDPAGRYQTARELLQDLVTLRESLGTQVKTQGVSLSQARALLASASSVKLPSVKVPVKGRGRKFAWLGAFVLSLVLAGGAGALVRIQRNHTPPAPPTEDGPLDPASLRDPPAPDPREAALLEALRKAPDLKGPEEIRRYIDALAQLAALYVQQRRLDDAEKLFKGLESAKPPIFQALAKTGKAVVLAYRDQAKESIQLFESLEKARPVAEHMLLLHPSLRRLVADAVARDAANTAPEALPEAVDKLRKLPIGARAG